MPEIAEDPESDLQWDELVDMVCVGGSPGVLAYAIACVVNDLDVLMVNAPAVGAPDAHAWYSEMILDLDPSLNPGREIAREDHPGFSLARVEPPRAPTGKRDRLETFVGEDLRRWSAGCLRSPFGVMFSQVPELLAPACADGGESITVALLGDLGHAEVTDWLRERARDHGLTEPGNILADVVLEEGRIAGVRLDDGYLVGARGGLAWPVDAGTDFPDTPNRDGLTVAVVGRPAGRFAAVDLLHP